MSSPEVLSRQLTAHSSTNIFSVSIPVATLQAAGITGPVYYGYRAWGPNWPFSSSWTTGGSGAGFISDVDAKGNRFNPNKLLIDPYAHEISQDPVNATWTDGTVYASGATNRNRDSGTMAPKSILWMPVSQSIGTKPTRAQKDDIIYEVNLRGLTKNDSSIPSAVRGTYAGAALKAPYLASLYDLGIATITTGQLATRFAGSSDRFGSRSPWNSTNLVVVHDGFTLDDLYSCNGPNNNQPWPYGPSDGGSSSNYSWDQNGIVTAQKAAARLGFALLMLSAGTPLMTGGDEYLRSLHCNNNTYNDDSIANWLNYSQTSDQSKFDTFVQGMIAFRKAHAALRPLNFYSTAQLLWWTPAGTTADATYFNNGINHSIAYQLIGSKLGDSYASIYVAYNGWSGSVNFMLPSPGNGTSWYRVTDTCSWAEGAQQVRSPGAEDSIGGQGSTYVLCGRGLVLLIAK